jgi:hypothetical protein
VEQLKNEENKAIFTKIQDEVLYTLQEIATNRQNRPIHSSSHKLGRHYAV